MFEQYNQHMKKVLGLDISTSITGVALINDNEPCSNIIRLEYIDFKKCKTVLDKAEHVKEVFVEWKSDPDFCGIDKIYVEEAMQRFTPGMSSMQTIGSLLRFNGIVSWLVYDILLMQPEYIAVGHARKTCGVKVQQKKRCGGLSHKEQTFKYMADHDLKDVTWEKKKNGDVVDRAYDMCDAYVIARAGVLQA